MISCHLYDYIEIVCMFRYPIRVTVIGGKVIEAVALDTKRNDSGVECIKLKLGDESILLPLDEILSLEVCVKNPHFECVSFNSQK